MMQREGASARDTVLQAALAGLLASGVRASLVVLRAMSAGSVSETRWRAAAQAWVDAALPAMGVGLLLALLARRSGAGRALAGALALVLGYLLATYQLPPSGSVYAPTLGAGRGTMVHAIAALVALVSAGLIATRPRSLLVGAGALGVAALIGAGTWAAVTRPAPARWGSRPNLILISLDTVRADRLGCYGYELETSPYLDAFAADALRFERAFATDIWTLTSHVSMLTGLPPNVHQVDRDRGLSPSAPTLAQLLRDQDYATYAVVDNCAWLNRDYGFARGFDIYRPVEEPAPDKIRQALELMDEAHGAPFFAFLHFYDAHSDWRDLPYEATPEDLALMAGWYDGDWTGCNDEDECASTLLQRMNERDEVLPEREARFVSSLYDAGIRTLDRDLAALWEGLENRGLLDNSVVVITADHGEEFFEYGKALHTQHHRGCTRVPLIVRTPDTVGGAVTESLACQTDIAPTFLSLLGSSLPDADWGEALAGILGDGAERAWVATGKRGIVQSLRAQVDGNDWGVVRRGDTWWADGPQGLVSLQEAPGAVRELVERAREIQDAQRDAREAYADGPTVGLSAKDRADLANIGYAGDE